MNTRSESAYEPLTAEQAKAYGLVGDGWYRQRQDPTVYYNPTLNKVSRMVRVGVNGRRIDTTNWFPDGETEEWLSRVGL